MRVYDPLTPDEILPMEPFKFTGAKKMEALLPGKRVK
jgi:hypothetical protein